MNKLLILLPTIIVIESALAGIIYTIGGRYGSALYWFSAALLNISAIWLIKRVG